jgi:hypothetical protein
MSGKKKEKEIISKLAHLFYKDALSGSVSVVGESLKEIVKTSLRPVEGVVWSVNKAFDWITDVVIRRFKKQNTDLNKIKSPPIELEGKIIIELQTAGPSEDPMLRNLFAALLSNFMNKDNPAYHPAYFEFLRQILPDEGKLISLLTSKPIFILDGNISCEWEPKIQKTKKGYVEYNWQKHIPKKFLYKLSGITTEINLLHSDNIEIYLANLRRLGIIEIGEYKGYHELTKLKNELRDYSQSLEYCISSVIEMRKNQPKCKQKVPDVGFISVELIENIWLRTIKLSAWGWSFAHSCSADEFYDRNTRKNILPEWAS